MEDRDLMGTNRIGRIRVWDFLRKEGGPATFWHRNQNVSEK